jgi:hypothetical protein
MDSLGGYIAAIVVSVAGARAAQYVAPKIKIVYWLSNFLYRIPNNQVNPGLARPIAAGAPQQPEHWFLLTHSVSIQNLGRRQAQWIEVVHKSRPDFFQLNPPLNYTETQTQTGEHVLRIESLAPREWFTIQFLSYKQQAELAYIRSEAGHANVIAWMPARQFPRWYYVVLQAFIYAGFGFTSYWAIRGIMCLWRLCHL